MKIIDTIYRKELIEIVLHSFKWKKEKINYLFQLINKDRKFMHSCVRIYRGELTITKRIARLRSGCKIY